MFDPEKLLADGWKAAREGRPGDARDLFAQAVAESRFNPDRSVKARSLKALGKMERDLKRPVTAIQNYRDAAAIYRELGDQLAWAHTVRHVADMLRQQNKLQESTAAYEEVVGVYRTRPDRNGLDFANALRGFALVKDAMGDHEGALLLWRGAVPLYEAAGVAAGVAECQSHIAFLLGH